MYIKRTSADAGFGTGSGRICFFSNSSGRGSVLVGDFFEIFLMKGGARACLKNAFREMCFTVCGEFIPNLGVIAGYVD